jgi:4Fe-4S ferredoxin
MSNLKPEIPKCEPEAGKFIPVIDPARCEAKGPCVPICPYQVIELRPLTKEQKLELSFLGRLKAKVHGNKRAFISLPDACHACGLCISICPEKAITLQMV